MYSSAFPCYFVLLSPIIFPAPYFRTSSPSFPPLVIDTVFRAHLTFQGKPYSNLAPQYSNSRTTTKARIAMNLLVIHQFLL